MATDRPIGFDSYASCIGATKAPSIFNKADLLEPGAQAGLRNLNPDKLRCFLLTQKIAEVAGNQGVLDLENWYDCRIQYPPNPNVIINKALADMGFGKTTGQQSAGGSAFDQLAADLEDNVGSAADPLTKLLQAVTNLPAQDTIDRRLFEDQRKFVINIALPTAAKYIKQYFPAAAGPADDATTIVKNVVDMAIATVDYVTEYKKVRSEAASRLYSVQRRDYVDAAYAKQYGLPAGSRIASSTVNAWCRFGNRQVIATDSPYAYLSAPDGTDGASVAAAEAVRAKSLVVRPAAEKFKAEFGNNWQKFFGLSGMLASWALAYSRDDFFGPTLFDFKNPDYTDRAGFPGYGSNSIMRYVGVAANEGKDEYPLWQDAGDTNVNAPRLKAMNWDNTRFGMTLDANAGEKPRLVKVWWPNHGLGGKSALQIPEKIDLLKKSTAFMYAGWAPGTKWEDFFGKRTRQAMISSPKLTGGFAADLWEVWKFWEGYVLRARPYFGKVKKYEFMRDEVFFPNVGRFFAALEDRTLIAKLNKMSWEQRLLFAMAGETFEMAEAKKRTPSSCPSGTVDCLPCEVIRTRLPIGAKSIDIPMEIDYSGANPRKSPEFAVWAKNLSDNGYPGYYIDCIARDVRFRSKTTKFISTGEEATKTSKASAAAERAAYVAQKAGGGSRDLYAGLNGLGVMTMHVSPGPSGIVAPYFATLDALPPPPVMIPELHGITRPLMIEFPKGKK